MSVAVDEVSIVYDAADLRSLYAACARCRRNLFVISMIPTIFFLFDVISGDRGEALVSDLIAYSAAAVFIAFVLYFVSPSVTAWRRARNGWGRPMFVSLTPNGLAMRHPAQDSSYHWSAIKKVMTSRTRIFIFTTPVCAIILPRRVFSSDQQFEAWSQQAERYWRTASPQAAP